MAINAFSNLTITVSNGGTVPSIDYLDKPTYVDIGSGNVLKVSWNTPTATNNAVDTYKIYILSYDSGSASYKSLYTANIGNVNEFYLKSSLFASDTKSFFQLRIYVEAISKYGSSYNGTSNTVSVYVSKGCGNYTKVASGYSQPVMKRTLAFAKVNQVTLAAKDGTQVTDDSGKSVYVKLLNTQDDASDWALMQEFYHKDTTGKWQQSDIQYEVLTDANGDIVTDGSDSPIYML